MSHRSLCLSTAEKLPVKAERDVLRYLGAGKLAEVLTDWTSLVFPLSFYEVHACLGSS